MRSDVSRGCVALQTTIALWGPVLLGEGPDPAQRPAAGVAATLHLDGHVALPANDEVALQPGLRSPEPDRDIHLAIGPPGQQLHQDEVLQRPAEVGAGRPLDPAPRHSPGDADIE